LHNQDCLRIDLRGARRRFAAPWLFLFVCAAAVVYGTHAQSFQGKDTPASETKASAKAIELKTSAFKEGETIPKEFTKDGRDVSPAFQWSDPPEGTKTFALICNDPGVGRNGFPHWVIFNIPAKSRELAGELPTEAKLPDGAVQGKNGFGKIGYRGPAPPPGKPHHYHFTIYALDTTLDLQPGANRAQTLEAMKGHILAEGTRIGVYQRTGGMATALRGHDGTAR
jgi:Raf kinase inhibitor-like YbhB/YbcL family protein